MEARREGDFPSARIRAKGRGGLGGNGGRGGVVGLREEQIEGCRLEESSGHALNRHGEESHDDDRGFEMDVAVAALRRST